LIEENTVAAGLMMPQHCQMERAVILLDVMLSTRSISKYEWDHA